MSIELLLASASPRRRELLAQIGVPCTQRPSEVDEQVLPGESPEAYVERVTRDKALAAVAACPGRALDMLGRLSADAHWVMTAVAVARDERIALQRVDTRVCFRRLSAQELADYWDTGEPADKAGAYGIQGLGAVFVERIEGSYSAVVGLPLRETASLLEGFGISCWQRP